MFDDLGNFLINTVGLGGNEKFQVNGNSIFNGYIKTAAPSANGDARWKLGKRLNAAVTLQTDKYIEVEIEGVIYKLALVQ